jgi:cathepsin C
MFGQKGGADFKAALAKAQNWAKTYKSSDEIPDKLIPETYDYRNIDGFDFTNPLRD